MKKWFVYLLSATVLLSVITNIVVVEKLNKAEANDKIVSSRVFSEAYLLIDYAINVGFKNIAISKEKPETIKWLNESRDSLDKAQSLLYSSRKLNKDSYINLNKLTNFVHGIDGMHISMSEKEIFKHVYDEYGKVKGKPLGYIFNEKEYQVNSEVQNLFKEINKIVETN